MPTDTLTDRPRHETARHLEHVRRFKRYLTVYLLSMLVLTPVWIVTQYESADGWPEHLSTRSRYAGDWDPWIIWVALIGAAIVGYTALRAYVLEDEKDEDVKREQPNR
ncbi:MAG TPA: hypothetical protein VFR32_07825 [Gaiellaceae bacterium]|nr:hypothetical protein [Gaiellaceae bacterium]